MHINVCTNSGGTKGVGGKWKIDNQFRPIGNPSVACVAIARLEIFTVSQLQVLPCGNLGKPLA